MTTSTGTFLANDIGPLDWRVGLVDSNGKPTPEFQRRWEAQRGNNDLIGSIVTGTGAPTITGIDGGVYVDTNSSPWQVYLYHSNAWHTVGVVNFKDLKDVPHTYAGSALSLPQVKSDMTGLQFSTVSAVLDSLGSAAKGDLIYRGTSTWSFLAPGTAGYVLTSGGTGGVPTWSAPAATGVTSVGLSGPSIFTVSGSPVTSSGTLTFSLNTQAANIVFAGPSSGSAATPTFRSLVLADLPSGIGTVTSVALSAPSIFTVSGSPVTTNGTLTFSLATQAANKVFAGPSTGSAATPTFRSMAFADLPVIPWPLALGSANPAVLVDDGAGTVLSIPFTGQI